MVPFNHQALIPHHPLTSPSWPMPPYCDSPYCDPHYFDSPYTQPDPFHGWIPAPHYTEDFESIIRKIASLEQDLEKRKKALEEAQKKCDEVEEQLKEAKKRKHRLVSHGRW